MSQIQQALRACADTAVTPMTPHWHDNARRLMRQAADALDAAEEAMAANQAPPAVTPLTDGQIQLIWNDASGALPGWSRHIAYARAIERAHRIGVFDVPVQQTQSHREWLEERYSDLKDGSWGGHP
jgi:hypothetical protein